jgi:type II secretory pathway pseudopilin PulG
MGTVVGIVVAIVLIVIVAAIAFFVVSRRRASAERRRQELRQQFGPEYDRAVQEYGSAEAAEPMLLARTERVSKLNIRPLSSSDKTRFVNAWQTVQAEFVDDPASAVGNADSLIAQVMEARGYPVDNFEQQASNVSVEHPDVVENYRAGHRIALQQRDGHANTEDLRQAVIHYRALFSDLLENPQS